MMQVKNGKGRMPRLLATGLAALLLAGCGAAPGGGATAADTSPSAKIRRSAPASRAFAAVVTIASPPSRTIASPVLQSNALAKAGMLLGAPIARIEGPAKVSGTATYADEPFVRVLPEGQWPRTSATVERFWPTAT